MVYLKWSDLNGPRYVMDSSLIANINYQDGRQDKFNQQTSNAYAPGNQQTGAAMYNDKDLLDMDIRRGKIFDIEKKIKQYKTIAWGVGVPCIVVGVCVLTYGMFCEEDTAIPIVTVGTIIGATGVVIFPLYLTKAHKLSNQAKLLTTAPVYQHEFNLGNGKSLCAGVDVIRDRQYKQTTLGVGLQYNF